MKQRIAILVVEDDVSGRILLDISLRKAGYDVDAVPGGAEALRRLGNKHYDWMVTDGRMQPMDGFELSRQAKRVQPDLNIAMISAIYTDRDLDGYPIDKFIPKPFTAEQLMETLTGPAA